MMISVSEARKKIMENCRQTKTGLTELSEACGFVLAENLSAPIDSPNFDQSAMDGYAFRFEDWDGTSDLKVIGEVQTGKYFEDEIHRGEAVRIFTGAAMPAGVDTVVIQENVSREKNLIKINDKNVGKGSNVRHQGSQTKKGQPVLNEGHLLSPATISFLAGLGVTHVSVYMNPTVSILTTGKELVKPGKPLGKGKIYESNSFGLKAALQQLNIHPAAIATVDDEEEKITKEIQRQLEIVDILILTGGVSVGDYDFVTAALEKCGVKKVFHKVKQRPGKPFYFGKRNETLVFGLPGNPASVLTCFYQYVAPAISCFSKRQYYRRGKMPLANDYNKKAGLTFFLKGKTNEEGVAILNNQASYLMNSFAVADCIIELEEEKEQFTKGEMVDVLMIV